MIYGSAGTLYFDDLPAHIDGKPLQIMAFVFFFTGMAFKLSAGSVPFMDGRCFYEGAPSTVTIWSVISKRFGSICADGNSDQSIRTDDT